jgi:cell wall-associated NlpC family hydrolase
VSGPAVPTVEGLGTIRREVKAVQARLGSLNHLATAEATMEASFATTLRAAEAAQANAAPALATEATMTEASPIGQAASGVSGREVVQEAERFLGVPYRWGGTSPTTGFDCSGFVQYVYRQLGISLPRTSEEQAHVGIPVKSLADARPGDLLFFEPGPGGPGHVGIYVGHGEMIDAPYTGTVVRFDPVSTPPVAIRQIVGDPADSLAGLGVPPSLTPLVERASASTGVPARLLAAVLRAESDFHTTSVSSAGAEGIAQLMPGVARSLGVDPFNPAQAVPAAAHLLAGYHRHFGSWALALAAYNAGPGAVERYGGIPPYPETSAYVQEILRWTDEGATP